MRKSVTWIAVGMLLGGCQTHAVSAEAAHTGTAFEVEALRLTEGYGDVVLLEVDLGGERRTALVVRYVEHAPTGAPLCTLFIIEQSEATAAIVETNDELLACSNAPGAELVKHALEARVDTTGIRLEEQHVRSHSTFDFARGAGGRWHLVYGDHVGPENNPEGGDLLLVTHTVAYATPAEGPTVSDFNREAISKDVVRSVVE